MGGGQETDKLSSEGSPFFQGSITEAIGVAKSQAKSLIIYIAEENEDYQRMDQITWQDCKVQKALLEQFVTLRLWHRSTDAAHFAVIFPYTEVPCISVISHNGKLLNRLGGYAAPADLLSMLEQAITAQRTALASNEPTPVIEESQTNKALNEPECAGFEIGGSSVMNNDSDTSAPASSRSIPLDDCTSQPEHSASAQMHMQAGRASTETQEDIVTPQMPVQTIGTLPEISEYRRPQMDSGVCDVLSGASSVHDNVASRALETLPKDPLVTAEPFDSGVCDVLSGASSSQDNVASRALETLPKDPLVTAEPFEQEVIRPQIMVAEGKTKKSTETFLLQVRLTNGKSIRKIFNAKDCLAVVKEFVDENRDDGNASYSLGMLYPRKVFSESDMGKTLLELSLDDRANLILITRPMQQTSPAPASISTRGGSSDVTNSQMSGGLWKFLSYLNPLSYFSGSSSDTNNGEPRSASWQYEPDPQIRSSFRRGSSESHGSLRPDVDEANTSTGKKASQGRKWGGNVHTLPHNDNEEAFKRGNAFWNGNSTQYGGGDDSKK